MNLKQLLINKELIEKTAIFNCHAIGLHSFIINEHPKTRLFIADSNCELRKKFYRTNPIIPIHAHKYDDLFIPLKGTIVQHIYEICKKPFVINFQTFAIYKYNLNRIDDKDKQINVLGASLMTHIRSIEYNAMHCLKAETLHTVSINSKECAWLIIEGEEDKNYQQVAYHQNLVSRSKLYKPFINPYEYLLTYFNLK